VSLSSIHGAYGFYRKLGFTSEHKNIDLIWDTLNSQESHVKKCRYTSIIEKRIIKHNRNRAKTLIEKVDIIKKINYCLNKFDGDVSKMYSEISETVPKGLISMTLKL